MRVMDHFLALTKIDSPSGEEDAVRDYLRYFLECLDFTIDVDELGNMLCKRDGRGMPLLLCAHMDTVEPGRGIKPSVQGEYIVSMGETILGADNKASISAIITATEACIRGGHNGAFELLFTVREETGGGVEYFDCNKLRSEQGIIIDAPMDKIGGIVIGSPSIINFALTFTGKAAHASKPNEGVSALTAAATFVADQRQGLLDGDKTTINIGTFEAGTGINTVPASAIVKGEVRSFDTNLFDLWRHDISSNANQAAASVNAQVDIEFSGFCHGFNIEPKNPLLDKINRVFCVLSIEPYTLCSPCISDANPLVTGGINVIPLTDGVIDPHTTQERIRICDLELLDQIVRTFITI